MIIMRSSDWLTGPPVAGLLVDWSHEPGLAMTVSAGVIGAATLLAILTLISDNRHRARRTGYTQI